MPIFRCWPSSGPLFFSAHTKNNVRYNLPAGDVSYPPEGHLTRRRFGAMLGRIALLPIPTG
jgi:hypothetical protein